MDMSVGDRETRIGELCRAWDPVYAALRKGAKSNSRRSEACRRPRFPPSSPTMAVRCEPPELAGVRGRGFRPDTSAVVTDICVAPLVSTGIVIIAFCSGKRAQRISRQGRRRWD
jgi:hypothetical protein